MTRLTMLACALLSGCASAPALWSPGWCQRLGGRPAGVACVVPERGIVLPGHGLPPPASSIRALCRAFDPRDFALDAVAVFPSGDIAVYTSPSVACAGE